MADAAPLTRLYLLVEGRVQGVGFRWFVRDRAESLGLAGWTRNREDGTVEAEVEGSRKAVDAFVTSLRDHPTARVDSIVTRPAVVSREVGFTIR
ncbi:MAG: hypothetical protein A2506_05980 [Elusimicrobia bacterium RIFOXYD12_FULL_66_9]|nr:MAG: hypothetical protein A2506_05980 [Elusimicrobia bacterium RIFOXYD12_FULL_66_9]